MVNSEIAYLSLDRGNNGMFLKPIMTLFLKTPLTVYRRTILGRNQSTYPNNVCSQLYVVKPNT